MNNDVILENVYKHNKLIILFSVSKGFLQILGKKFIYKKLKKIISCI